jgi:uncharacterized protein
MRLRDRLSSLSSSAFPSASTGLSSGLAEQRSAFADSRDVTGGGQDQRRSQRIAQLRAMIGAIQLRDASSATLREPVALGPRPLPWGAALATGAGPVHRIERWLDPQHRHGRVTVALALQADSALLARLALDETLHRLDLSRMLFLDTETTGLAGGTGTVPFLIGLGWFEEGVLKVEQLFLQNFGAEAPLLHRLAERMAQASCLVSYNGKSFDWPLLRSRFILNRVACPDPPPHVDLLHCARRVLKRRLGSLRLVEVEQSLLGFHREGDIDGAEIPGRYLSYLRGADPRLLLPVLEHNEHDIVALAAVLWRLCAHFERIELKDDPRDHLSYARVAMRAGDFERAQLFGQAAVAGGDCPELLRDAFSLCAMLARRRGEVTVAAGLWQRVVEVAPCQLSAARAHLALSRLYERQIKDLHRAEDHARWTLPAEGEPAHQRRLQRLRMRISRTSAARGARSVAPSLQTGGQLEPA